jgi:hypothetical protein
VPSLPGRFAALAIAILTLAALVAESPAADSVVPPRGTPDPRLMVLKSSDLGGAKVTKQRYYKDTDFPSVISYERDFESGRVGSVRLSDIESDAEIGTNAQTTASFLRSIKQLFGSPQGRALIRDSFGEEFPSGGLVSDVRIGRPRALGVGSDSFDLLVTVRILGLRTELHIAAFKVERVFGSILVVSPPGRRIPVATMTRLARTMAARMTAELAPESTAPPAISGSAQVGQTLTASTGTWAGSPSTFTYAWRRCDTAGANCAGIPNASGPSYVLQDADAGATIRVAVTARNAAGVATAVSAQTPVVAAVAAPTNTSAPTITGTPQAGQTLTAGAGSWTGNPTSFGFQWQRCDSAGANCVGISGATAGTYVLGSADQASTIRVSVTATNSVGSATTLSAQTPVVT